MEKKNQVPKYPHLRFPEFTDEWKEVTLGEVAAFFSGGTPSTYNKTFYKGDIPFIRSGEIHDSRTELAISKEAVEGSSAKIVFVGDILLALYGATSGDIAISKMRGAINQAILCIRPSSEIDRDFLFFIWEYRKEDIVRKYIQGGQGNLSAEIVKNIPLRLPSLAEQRKIAGLLSLIDERIEVQNAIIKEREAQKAALLRRLFDRTLRFPEFTDEWKEVKLGEVAEIIGGGTPSTTTTNYWDGEIVWFNPSEIGKKKYVSNSNRTISFQGLSNSGARLLPKGTVLLTTRATIGEIAIANVECTTNQGFQSVVTGHEANNEYVYYFLSTQKVYLLRHSSGSTFLETPSSVIRNLPLRLPSLPEQKKIAALLSALDERIAVETEYAALLQKQKAYLLRQMFV